MFGFFFSFRGDWLLGFVYRGSSVQLSVAGLQPISSQNRHIINVDLSSVVSKSLHTISRFTGGRRGTFPFNEYGLKHRCEVF